MTVERFVHAFAGTMVLLSVLLAYTVHPYWIGLAVFVGANLLQTAFTRFCPLAIVLRRLGIDDPVPPAARSI